MAVSHLGSNFIALWDPETPWWSEFPSLLVCWTLFQVLLSCVWLFVTTWTVAHQWTGSSVHGILQARVLEWVVISFSRGSSHPGTKPVSPALQVESLPLSQQGSPTFFLQGNMTTSFLSIENTVAHINVSVLICLGCHQSSEFQSLCKRKISPSTSSCLGWVKCDYVHENAFQTSKHSE